ncbi:MAG: bifunctional riboflavin kinase/FAD synthetase [Candidatus Aminicenantes bacterium]|jgi:riboflavin kinase/FMN adenylyltransferase|nr:bifunctional riboflavin kinase/FAD synthetase [Candidatus Aminicenantes bacterium]
MKIFHQLSPQLKIHSRNSVLAVGIFDGLHLGHQKILKTAVAEARKLGSKAGVMSFSPHPDKFLNHQPVKLIQTLEQRIQGFSLFGLDYSLILSLEPEIVTLSGEDFAREILKDLLQVKQVVVGTNFRFGQARSCGVKDLLIFGEKFGFKVKVLKPVRRGKHLISSSLIRKCLEKGQVEKARLYLGRPYEIRGKVIQGQKLGRKLGFPTINLLTENEILPRGVFLSLALLEKKLFPAVSNIGFRPTINGQELMVETHLLGLKSEHYGQKLSLFLLKKIRAEKKFSSLEKLKEQIKKDIDRGAIYFRRQAGPPSDLLDFLPDLVDYKHFKS